MVAATGNDTGRRREGSALRVSFRRVRGQYFFVSVRVAFFFFCGSSSVRLSVSEVFVCGNEIYGYNKI